MRCTSCQRENSPGAELLPRLLDPPGEGSGESGSDETSSPSHHEGERRICAGAARVARVLVERGHTSQYGYALQALTELPYSKWRDYDPEDTVRFYALRLHEAGMIKSSPQKIMAQGTDWRFFNELKKELKG